MQCLFSDLCKYIGSRSGVGRPELHCRKVSSVSRHRQPGLVGQPETTHDSFIVKGERVLWPRQHPRQPSEGPHGRAPAPPDAPCHTPFYPSWQSSQVLETLVFGAKQIWIQTLPPPPSPHWPWVSPSAASSVNQSKRKHLPARVEAPRESLDIGM